MNPRLIWWKIVTTFYRRLSVVTKDVDPALPVHAARVDVSIEPLTEDQLDDYLVFRPNEKREEIERRIAAGDLCFAAWHDGRIVHAGWSASGRVHVPYIHSDLLLGEEEFFIYDSFTLREFRRSNIVIARSSVMHAYYGQRGRKRSFGVVALMNSAGLAAVRSAGYREIGMYGCVRIAGVHHAWAFENPLESIPRLVPPRK